MSASSRRLRRAARRAADEFSDQLAEQLLVATGVEPHPADVELALQHGEVAWNHLKASPPRLKDADVAIADFAAAIDGAVGSRRDSSAAALLRSALLILRVAFLDALEREGSPS